MTLQVRPASRPPRLVVLRALGLGDLLTAVPAMRALERAFPDHAPELAAPGALGPLVELIGDRWRVVDTAPLEELSPTLHGATVAVNLHGRGPQSHAVLMASRPSRLIAFRHEEVRESALGPEWRVGEHEVARWCRMLVGSGVPADPGELRLEAPSCPPPPEAVGATIVHPGAASGARRWPAERFAFVARAERTAGRPVAVTGSPAERALARRVAEGAGLPASAVLAGRTDLAELAAAVGAAARVVCGDTGVAHLATALGTRSVVLFGPTAPAEWGPPPGRRHRALWAGRVGDPHAEAPGAGLLEIDPEDVMAALEELEQPTSTLARAIP